MTKEIEMAYTLKAFQPMLGIPVRIKTNWASYKAILQRSSFGGYEFQTLTGHKVQTTVVTEWQFIN